MDKVVCFCMQQMKRNPPYLMDRVIGGVPMATDDVAQLADSLAKTQVVGGELSYKGKGLKLDNAESGELDKRF